jgi:hypothetical protein
MRRCMQVKLIFTINKFWFRDLKLQISNWSNAVWVGSCGASCFSPILIYRYVRREWARSEGVWVWARAWTRTASLSPLLFLFIWINLGILFFYLDLPPSEGTRDGTEAYFMLSEFVSRARFFVYLAWATLIRTWALLIYAPGLTLSN